MRRHREFRYIPSLLFLLLGGGMPLFASAPWVVNEPGEIRFQSDSLYDHPIRSVRVRCTFTHGLTRTRYTHDLYWDGDGVYRVRFAPPLSGEWSWRTSASDTMNHGLHGIVGTFIVEENDGDGVFDRHGWLKPSDDGRYLAHESGKPFFWLGCTAWEMVWKSRLDQVRAYVADRQRKTFTAIQIVVTSHHFNFDYGVVNRNGDSSQRDRDPSLYNPDYFRYLDSVVELVNDHDMVAVLVPMWAHISELYRNPDSGKFVQLDAEQCLALARYVGARYAGHNVVWIVGGDNAYDTPARKGLMTAFAQTLDEASGGRHLSTIHPHGWGASFDYFDNSTDWLDFHLYQSSHGIGAEYAWHAALTGYGLTDPKPVLNGEACYEDIHDGLWQPGDPGRPETMRINAYHVRQASYESVLSGSLVGITYGANGLWQWHTAELPGMLQPTYYVESAIHLPGSGEMKELRTILEEVGWYRLRPWREGFVRREGVGEEFVPCASDDSLVVGYIPMLTVAVTFRLPHHVPGYRAQLIRPTDVSDRRSIEVATESDEGMVTIIPPDSSDWIVVFQKEQLGVPPTPVPPLLDHRVVPNPHVGGSRLLLSMPDPAHGELHLVDLLGRDVGPSDRWALGAGSTTLQLPRLPAGRYSYRLRLEFDTGVRTEVTGVFISLGL